MHSSCSKGKGKYPPPFSRLFMLVHNGNTMCVSGLLDLHNFTCMHKIIWNMQTYAAQTLCEYSWIMRTCHKYQHEVCISSNFVMENEQLLEKDASKKQKWNKTLKYV